MASLASLNQIYIDGDMPAKCKHLTTKVRDKEDLYGDTASSFV